MFCGNCGSENANGAKFCKSCGKALDVGENDQCVKKIIAQQGTSNNNEGNNVTPSIAKVDISNFIEKVKAIPKKIWVGIGIVALALILVIFFALNAKPTINLNDYLIIETSGYDGYGTVGASIDWDAIEDKYGEKISFTNEKKAEYDILISYMTPVEVLKDCVSIKLETSSGLTNGDEIAYTWDIDEDLLTYLKCKVKCKDNSYSVSGLTEVGSFDAFSDLEVTFSGVAPNGSANIIYNGSDLSNYDFDCDKTNGLSNEDTITVSISDSKLEYYVENLGMVPETLKKEYTVEGLSSYLSKISEISDKGIESMQQQASDVYNAIVAKNWEDGESLESFTYIGNYLLTTKDQDSYGGSNNVLYMVYKAQVHNNYSNDEDTYDEVNNIYWYISFNNLMVNPDGELIVDVTGYDTPNASFNIDSGISSGWWSTQSWYYDGYQTLDELYKDIVISYLDSYNHEDNVDESVAPTSVEKTE